VTGPGNDTCSGAQALRRRLGIRGCVSHECRTQPCTAAGAQVPMRVPGNTGMYRGQCAVHAFLVQILPCYVSVLLRNCHAVGLSTQA
jgi:hypothetical protein